MRKAVSQKAIGNRQFISSKNDVLNKLIENMQPQQPETVQSLGVEVPLPEKAPVDSLTLLLNKASQVTKPIKRLKRAMTIEKYPDNGNFLTGVNLVEREYEALDDKPEPLPSNSQALDEEIKHLLNKKTIEDELLILKKQMVVARGNLRSYEKDTMRTKRQMLKLADRYNSYINFKIPTKNFAPNLGQYSEYKGAFAHNVKSD